MAKVLDGEIEEYSLVPIEDGGMSDLGMLTVPQAAKYLGKTEEELLQAFKDDPELQLEYARGESQVIKLAIDALKSNLQLRHPDSIKFVLETKGGWHKPQEVAGPTNAIQVIVNVDGKGGS